MSSLKFQGGFEELTDKQCQYIRDVLEKRGFEDNKVVFAPVGNVGDNYAANVKRITVELENGENFSMVAKIAPATETQRVMNNTAQIFNNEAVMYLEIFPKFRELQNSANVHEDKILRFPECYGCNTEAPDEVILLEDLKKHNFFMLDILKSIPDEAVKLVLQNFAILHSLSFALNKIEPDTYENLSGKLFNMWNASIDKFPSHVYQIQQDAVKLFKNDIKYKTAVHRSLYEASKLTATLDKIHLDSICSVIIQGDAWTNNLMFKTENHQLKECIMVDYQMARHANPISDVLYMIFVCTDYKTRAEHLCEWFDYYYRHLDISLRNFGMEVSFVYPKYQMDLDIKMYSKVFFGIAIVLFAMLVRKPDEAVIMQNAMKDNVVDAMAISLLSSESIDLFKSKVRDLVDSCQEFKFMKI